MDIIAICISGAAFILGCLIVWLYFRNKNSKNVSSYEEEIEQLTLLKDNLQLELNKAKNKIDTLQLDSENFLQEKKILEDSHSKALLESEKTLKENYDRLISQIQEEKINLENALNLAREGKIDESISAQLNEAKAALSRVSILNNEIEDLKKSKKELLDKQEPLMLDLAKYKEDCDKLSKKVKKLEDELEDAEEEQEALEKKLKVKTNELQTVNDELDNEKKITKNLQNDLQNRTNELASTTEELNKKNDSIEFVQEILSAPETGTKDIKALYKAIDFFESFLRGQFMECNAYLYNKDLLSFNDISGRKGFEEKKKIFIQLFEEWSSVKRKSWLDRKTTIAFVGEFSAGKTSIVNRILSQDNPNIPLLPVSTKATTAIPTYIAGSDYETYNFVTPNDILKSINEEIFKKVSKEVLDEIKGVSSLIKYFVMTYKNPNLDGLSILDTPGFNSNDKEDKLRTIEVINECDALFWVFDVNAGTVNRSSISLIKEKLNKPLYVVINKVDTKAKSEVDKVESLIRNTLNEEGLKVEQFIRFSAKAPLKDIMNPIHTVPHDSNRDSFLEIVRQDIEDVLEIFNNYVKEADNVYHQWQHHVHSITDNYNEGMQDLYHACDVAAGIPHWETHFWSSDRYEMSAEEGNQLKNLLNEIATTKSNNLANIYNEEMDAVMELQNAYSILLDHKNSWQKINDCLTEFKKTSKNLVQ